MPFVVYFFVLVITAGSVLSGLDWLSAPMSPMPASHYELHAAKPPPPPPSVAVENKSAPAPVQTAGKPEPAPTQPQATAAAPVRAAEPVPAPAPVVAAASPAPKCDLDACAAAYRSFTPADCTYQPNDGPRRLCTKGTPPAAAAPSAPPGSPARAQAACNVAACSRAYFTFDAVTCTYQPSDGPRRLCEK